MGKNILGVIQARGGSKGIPGKNIKLLNGMPLIYHTIEAALKSNIFTHFAISSDDDKILQLSEGLLKMSKYAGNCFTEAVKRPDELAVDQTLSVDSLHWLVEEIEVTQITTFDYVVELPCVCPLRQSHHITEAVDKLITTNADSVISVTQVQDKHPVRMKRIVDDQIQDFCSEYPEGDAGRRQDLEPCYVRNGGIYSMKRDTLINHKTRHGKDSRPYVMDEVSSVNIDTEMDFKLAEAVMKEML
jgi:CMP-N-acetylneuraminic acid synthetase